MIPERFAKTIRIPIRIEDGQPKFFYDGELPQLAEGAVGELILYAHALVKPRDRERLDLEQDSELLPGGSRLLVEVGHPGRDQGLVRLPSHQVDAASETFVEVVLVEPLRIQLRSSKRARLHPSACHVPALDRRTDSLNQACTVISEEFEPWRASHTMNAFRKAFYRTTVAHGDFWRPLDTLREQQEAAFERLLFKPRGGKEAGDGDVSEQGRG